MDTETAAAAPRSPVSCIVSARGHEVVQDKPPEYGGEDKGLMASEHLLVALLSCQLSTFYKIAAKRRSQCTAERIEGALHFDDAGDIERVALTWHLEGGDAKQRDTLIRLTDKVCTISRVLNVPIDAVVAPDS